MKLRLFDLPARFEEQTKQSALANYFDKRSKSKEWNQYQQHYDGHRNKLMKRTAADFSDGICKRSVMNVSNNHFLEFLAAVSFFMCVPSSAFFRKFKKLGDRILLYNDIALEAGRLAQSVVCSLRDGDEPQRSRCKDLAGAVPELC